MATKQDYESKYGNIVVLSDEANIEEKGAVITYTSIYKTPNGNVRNRRMCACLDCSKTFSNKKPEVYSYTNELNCPDCGAEQIRHSWSQDNQPRVETFKNNGVYYVLRPKTEVTYGNYDETGTASKLNHVIKGDIYMIYPSNKMHKAPFELQTSLDLREGTWERTILNTEDKDNPKVLTNYQLADVLEENRDEFGSSLRRISLHAYTSDLRKADKLKGEVVDLNTYSKEFDELAYIELQKRHGLPPYEDFYKKPEPSVEQLPGWSNDNYLRRNANNRNRQSLITICSRYPGVTDMVLSQVNENIAYMKTPHTAEDDAMMRGEALLAMADKLRVIDKGMNRDLRKLKTKEQVSYYLEAIIYGKNAMQGKDNPIPNSVENRLNIKPERSEHDGFGNPKKLRKRFNVDPLLTAHTVYTAIKVSPVIAKDTNHANHIFECIDAERKYCEENNTTGNTYGYRGVYPNLIANGTLLPIETKQHLRYMRQYFKAHVDPNNPNPGITQCINDWYGNQDRTSQASRDRTHDFEDAAYAYTRLAKVGTIAVSRADCLRYQVYDAQRKIGLLMDEGKTQEEITEMLSTEDRFGKRAPACVGLLMDDIRKNGLPDPGDIGFVGRDGKPMLQNRTPHECHDELVHKLNSHNAGPIVNETYSYTDEQVERFTKSYDVDIPQSDGTSRTGQLQFRLMKDVYDNVRTGEQMEICVGEPHYCEDAKNGRIILCVAETEAKERVACIELSSTGDTIYQFKGENNNPPLPVYADACKQWLEDCNIDGKGCHDVQLLGSTGTSTTNYARRHLNANPYPKPDVIYDYYRDEIMRNAEESKELTAQAEGEQPNM